MMAARHTRLLASLMLVLLLPCLGCARQDGSAAQVKQGEIDLSGWDAGRDGPIALDGQWEFYWDRLLAPEDFRSDSGLPEKSGYLNVPGSWKGYPLDGQPLPGRGQATFRLRLLPGPGVRQLALRLFAIHDAYQLWANGQRVAASGLVGRSAATEIPHRSLVLAKIECRGTPVDLVLQVSNHTFRRGGLLHPIQLGQPEELERAHIRVWAWAMLFTGSLLVMAIYHFSLYFLRKKDISTLYFGLGCIVIICAYDTLDSSDWLVTLFFPQTDPDIVARVCLCSMAVLGSVLYRFYKSLYPKEFIQTIQYVYDLRSIVFVFIITTQSQPFIYDAVSWLAIITFPLTFCFFILLALCLRHGRDGALILLLGYLILSATSLNDIYWHFFSSNGLTLLPVGLLAFVLSQALAMAQRFSNAFTAVENLSSVLRTEMDERTRLEREIVNVSEEERRRLSHDLHDGLCQQLVGTRMRCATLARRPITEQDVAAEVAEIAVLVNDSVSQAYDLSRGLWPVERTPGEIGASLAELARRMARVSGVDIEYSQNLACACCCNNHLVQLFRIAQEAVANAVKHARPGCIDIALHCGPDRRLVLTVRDDGIGRQAVAASPGGLGLRIMAYRASMIQATLSIDDFAGGGTRVVCSLACTVAGTTQEDADG
ncbi:Adenylate cyclase [Desulfovibrio sp. DV]|uniref:7TM diverse intracellular signaling domain-containing protein n=1 Tax=Desulfovibrio sp. DV TaxID=1844708 RepID=UPI00094BBA45|nr:7TM diverse intracellular signaling domain-containing protein [Desulfovibrio sp. DV]OLN30372.1 Adenylate cyclase [Desulfovibrio sp. DV]